MRKVRENDCCGYKEKLAREKLRGNRRSRTGSVKKKKNVTPANCCYRGVDNNAAELEQKAKIEKCLGLKKKSKEIKKRQHTLQIYCGQLLSVIKPTYYDRERYANFQHLLCILDEEETVKWIKLTELREKWRKNLEFYQCGQKSEDAGAKKKEAKACQKEDQGVNGNEAEGEGCKKKNTRTVGGKKGKQVEQVGREAESTKMAKRECDSICSFDSAIDLTDPRKADTPEEAQKELPKDPLQDVPRRPLGLTDILTLDTPQIPLQPTSKSIFVLMTIGLMGLVTGCLVLVLQPYEYIFKWKATFGEGGEIYEIWRVPPVDLYLKIYLFNITNHEAYMAREETKLKFEQIGPYVYKEFLQHGNVTFNPNGTVTAVPLHPLKFIPELSNGTEEDIVVMPNIALLSIANVMKDSAMLSRWGLNLLIRQTASKPLVHMTAKEFMFGYESTLVTLGNHLMPAWIKFDRLGLIDRMYDFEGDYETVYTGEDNLRLTGLIEKYNGAENLPQWTGKCANVKGSSDGAKFQSFIEPNDTVLFFRKSLCRSERMYRTGEKTIKGLHAYQYKFVDHELDNGEVNPDNKCFCRQGYCLPYGLIDVTDCYYGFPIALSYPHFYKTAPRILAAVEGLKPDPEIHESYIYLNPKSGLPVELAFRFQINMALQDISKIDNVDGFSDLVLPLLWFEIGMYELPDNLNTKFFLYLNVLPAMQEAAIYCLFLTGAISLVWSVIKILTYKPKDSAMSSQWLESEMQRKRLSYFSERRPSLKAPKEMDLYFNTLLTTKEEDTIDPAALEELANLKEDIV